MPVGLLSAIPIPGPVDGSCKQVLAPPSGFRAAEGVVAAWLTGEGPFGATPKRSRGSAAQRAGKRYEKAALEHLANELPGFRALQWFRFWDGARLRFCQPDGFLLQGDDLNIFECKVTFTSDAWWQLRKLYEPVLRCAFRPKRVALTIICKHFDPMVPFPEEIRQLHSPAGAPVERIGVYSWTA